MTDRETINKFIAQRKERERLIGRVNKRNSIEEQPNIFTRFSETMLSIREPMYIRYVEVVAETEKGLLLKFPDRKDRWVPKSRIKINLHTRTLIIAKSMAHDKHIEVFAAQQASKYMD